MSDAPRYRVHLRRGYPVDAIDIDWRPGRLRVILPARRLELDHEANDGTHVRDGVTVREYPLAAVRFVDDRCAPEARR